MTIKNVCIIGLGNIGVAVAVDIANNTNTNVIIQTSKANIPNTKFVKIDSDSQKITSAHINITNDYDVSLRNADLVIITVPSFLTESVLSTVSKYSPKMILFIPGFGGKEYHCRDLLKKGCVVIGLNRSPYVARLRDSNTVVASKKKALQFACINNEDVKGILEYFFQLPFERCKNYLTVAFTPSNPILHTARLYSRFKECSFDTEFFRKEKFYAEWDNLSSDMLLKMDSELLKICNALKTIDLSGHISLKDYYGAKTVEEMTKKMTGIKSLGNIDFPMKYKTGTGGGYLIDKDSRYFIEDFPFGLCNLKGFGEILKVNTPNMDIVLKWYQKISGMHLFDNEGKFNGVDLCKTGIPQNFGIKTADDIEKFYSDTRNHL